MVFTYQRTTTNWAIGDQITAAHLQEINSDLDELFKRLDSRDLSVTYNILGQLTQVVDNQNSITINIDRTDRNATIPKLYIQELGDTKKFTLTYV